MAGECRDERACRAVYAAGQRRTVSAHNERQTQMEGKETLRETKTFSWLLREGQRAVITSPTTTPRLDTLHPPPTTDQSDTDGGKFKGGGQEYLGGRVEKRGREIMTDWRGRQEGERGIKKMDEITTT